MPGAYMQDALQTPEAYSLVGLLSAAPYPHGHQWHCEDVGCIEGDYTGLRRDGEGTSWCLLSLDSERLGKEQVGPVRQGFCFWTNGHPFWRTEDI